MKIGLGSLFMAVTQKRARPIEPPPLMVELLGGVGDGPGGYEAFPFRYQVMTRGGNGRYAVGCAIPRGTIITIRRAVAEISDALDPSSVAPLTFERLTSVLTELAAAKLGEDGVVERVKELSELSAYEAIGLSRLLAFAKDPHISEVFVDSDSTPAYVDHDEAGRCETDVLLTERERHAIETHVDTFGGYTLDYASPSLKNDLRISGAIMRVSVDVEPISINRFAMDARRLSPSSLSLSKLTELGVLTSEASAFLIAWLESGGNVTIIGETGTGKTTLLNALDEKIDPSYRRLYIEDAVETVDLLQRGFHQLKVKVDPFDRGADAERTKGSEIVKALHRSPDIVILGEIQSEEHSRAFFHALSAGAKGMQTFHASSIEQAIRRWQNIHGIPSTSLLDLGVMVQMSRPDRLGPGRFVTRVCVVFEDKGVLRLRELFARDKEFRLVEVCSIETAIPATTDGARFLRALEKARGTLGQARASS